MTRRGLALVAVSGALMLAQPAYAAAPPPLPRSLSTYLLGPKMIRAAVGVKAKDGALHTYSLSRGRLVKRYAAGSVTLAERNGTTETIRVAATARVTLNGKPSTVRALRAGMQLVVSHDGDLPAGAVYAASKRAPGLPYSVVSFLIGPRMYRAEIALRSADNVSHDFVLDRGRIRQNTLATLTLREADGTVATINLSPTVRVKLNGQNASSAQLRKGMMATTMRDGAKPADQVFATGK
jgi:hypothetical protein